MKSKSLKITKYIAIALIISFIAWMSIDIIVTFSVKSIPGRPEKSYDFSVTNQLLFYLENPQIAEDDEVVIDNDYIIAAITPSAEYINGRYDCIDFRMQTLIRLQYLYGDEIASISPTGSQMIKDAFLNAKYWMTEPGRDSICFWSENHQILFASAEYLAGQMWYDEIFTNDNSTGAERMQRAKNRINYWMEQRFYYGFSEINSNNYYEMNIGAGANFMQFASEEDSGMVEQMKMVMDLLFYDVASNMYNFSHIAPAGRQIVDNKVDGDGEHMRMFVDYVWGLNDDYKTSTHHMLINFVSMMEAEDSYGNKYYEVPEVILEIGRDTSARVIKSSSSLDLSEFADKNLIGHNDNQIMIQLAMESFSNPEIIHNSITYFNKYDMMGNKFINEFKYVNLSLFRNFGLLKPLSIIVNPMPNGVALQRANIYNYRTEYYKLATNQAYHPGSYGAQQSLSNAILKGNVSVFTTHPAKYLTKDSARSSPGYWTGFGRAPHSAQHENVLMSIYQLPKRSNIAEFYDVPQFTHTYFPEAFFDQVIIDGRYAFAQVNGAYISIIGASDLEYLEHSNDSAVAFRNGLENYPDKRFDLVQHGLNQFWIYELSDESNETFSQFISRVKSNNIIYNGVDTLSYNSNGNNYDLDFNGDFVINGMAQNLQYKRFDSEYIVANRESDMLVFSYNGNTLTLNFKDEERIYT